MLNIQIVAHTELTSDVANKIALISSRIHELDRAQTIESLQDRIGNNTCLLLIAYVEGELAGFKIGYQLNDDCFYSWLGGVDADFRKLGLAQSMLEHQEKWATAQGYLRLEVKTRNEFKAMLNMLVANHYQITKIETAAVTSRNKLFLNKFIN